MPNGRTGAPDDDFAALTASLVGERGVEEVRARHAEALAVMGAPPDERFDRLTRLAQRVLHVPIAGVTLIADDLAWFRSFQGLDLLQMARCDTFCDVTVTRNAVNTVVDATAEAAYRNLPAVVGETALRAYAGIPLHDRSGIAIGAFCVYDTEPREFSEDELGTLRELASWAETELVRSEDVERARTVQQALLPQRSLEVDGLDVAGVCLPVGAVGGDFFDWDLVRGQLVFALVDVMGKGTAAALHAATFRALLRARTVDRARAIDSWDEPAALPRGLGDIVRGVDRLMRADLDRTGSMVTGFLARYDAARHRLHYADAGHGLSVVVRAAGGREHLVSRDLPVGVDPEADWSDHAVDLGPGDIALTFSDGLFELLGGDRAAFDAVESLVRTHPDADSLVAAITALAAQGDPIDDVTAVVVRRPAER